MTNPRPSPKGQHRHSFGGGRECTYCGTPKGYKDPRPKSSCSCKIDHDEGGFTELDTIRYCPLHANAPRLLDALEDTHKAWIGSNDEREFQHNFKKLPCDVCALLRECKGVTK